MKPGYLIKNVRNWSLNLWSLSVHAYNPQMHPSTITGQCLPGDLALIIQVDDYSTEAKMITMRGEVGWARIASFNVVCDLLLV